MRVAHHRAVHESPTMTRTPRQIAAALALAAAAATPAFAATSYTSEAAFLAAVGGAPLTVESFETTPGGTPPSWAFPTVTVTCNGSVWCPTFAGTSTLLPTLGATGVYYSTPDTLTFSFAAPITAFGIDLRGLGTVGGTTFSGALSNGATATFFTDHVGDDSITQFVGIVDAAGFTSVTFSGTAPDDGLYFDRLQVAAVPEPQAIALLLAGLGVTAAAARRRRRG